MSRLYKRLAYCRYGTSTDATGSFPVTLLLPSARPESFESFIEKKFQTKHQGNRYFPPNKPERPWPLSNLFNCIFGVVDNFFFFFLSDISSLEWCSNLWLRKSFFLSAIVLIWRNFRYTASYVSWMWLLRHNRVRANDLRSIVSKRAIRTHIRWLKSPLRMRTTIKKTIQNIETTRTTKHQTGNTGSYYPFDLFDQVNGVNTELFLRQIDQSDYRIHEH